MAKLKREEINARAKAGREAAKVRRAEHAANVAAPAEAEPEPATPPSPKPKAGSAADAQLAAENARLDAVRKDERDKVTAELTATYGSNPETRAPLASKFDRIEKSREGAAKDSWKTNAGRAEARKNRLSKFENVVLQ